MSREKFPVFERRIFASHHTNWPPHQPAPPVGAVSVNFFGVEKHSRKVWLTTATGGVATQCVWSPEFSLGVFALKPVWPALQKPSFVHLPRMKFWRRERPTSGMSSCQFFRRFVAYFGPFFTTVGRIEKRDQRTG